MTTAKNEVFTGLHKMKIVIQWGEKLNHFCYSKQFHADQKKVITVKSNSKEDILVKELQLEESNACDYMKVAKWHKSQKLHSTGPCDEFSV